MAEVWKNHPRGERLYGPLWSIGSDGESSFRKARHILCMVKQIPPDSSLGRKLSLCLGLNTMTSLDDIVGTCDPKHVVKRQAF